MYDIILAIVLAFFITWILRFIAVYKKLSNECIYPKQRFYNLLKNFYEIFPEEHMSFKGEILKKGMKVKIITLRKNSYEGEIIGFNDKNVICIITKNAIVTNKTTNVKEIIILEK